MTLCEFKGMAWLRLKVDYKSTTCFHPCVTELAATAVLERKILVGLHVCTSQNQLLLARHRYRKNPF